MRIFFRIHLSYAAKKVDVNRRKSIAPKENGTVIKTAPPAVQEPEPVVPAKLVNGHAEKSENDNVPAVKAVPSVITAKPKNVKEATQAEPIVTAAAPNTFIPTTKVAPVIGEEAQAKKSGIRIKYSGINNGRRISEQNRNVINDTKPVVPPPSPSVIVNKKDKDESKENNQVLPAVAPKSIKEPDASFDEGVKLADIDDIELLDGSKIGFTPDFKADAMEPDVSLNTSVMSNASVGMNRTLPKAKRTNKHRRIATLRHKKMKSKGEGGNLMFACRHCGKKYRWKSTLRRHENDECGDKEPSHSCPYCPYKAKQRGNLGVHVRKHHSDKPELESKRKRRTM